MIVSRLDSNAFVDPRPSQVDHAAPVEPAQGPHRGAGPRRRGLTENRGNGRSSLAGGSNIWKRVRNERAREEEQQRAAAEEEQRLRTATKKGRKPATDGPPTKKKRRWRKTVHQVGFDNEDDMACRRATTPRPRPRTYHRTTEEKIDRDLARTLEEWEESRRKGWGAHGRAAGCRARWLSSGVAS